MTTYGFIRSTHDSEGNYKFGGASDDDEKEKGSIVPGIVHMLENKPLSLSQILCGIQEYNRHYPDAPFDIATVPRQLVAGLEVGAITMKEIK